MKILFTHDIFSSQRYGGVSRYFHELYKNLECRPIVFGGIYQNRYFSKDQIFGIKLDLNGYLYKIARLLNDIIQILIILIYRPDVIHYTYYPRFILRITNAKIVITVYDMNNEIFSSSPFSSYDITIRKKNIFKKADLIISISHSTKDDLISILSIPSEKIKVIHLASSLIDENSLQQPSAVNSGNKSYILYVGGRDGYKNFKSLIDAIKFTDFFDYGVELICFGSPPNANERFLISKYGFDDNIKFVNGDDQALIKLYQGARVLIYPSLYEGFGLPLLEAMGNKCPVFCFYNSSLIEVGGEAVHFIQNNKTFDLDTYYKDADYLNKLKAKGLERAKLFSWSRTSFLTEKVYKELVREKQT